MLEMMKKRKKWLESELIDILAEQKALIKEYSEFKDELDCINKELTNFGGITIK